MNSAEITSIIEESLPKSMAVVESDDNVHFKVTVVSAQFRQITSRLQRQRMVYDVLNPYIASGQIHAVELSTYTPEIYQQKTGINCDNLR